jgi:hypothetical protein
MVLYQYHAYSSLIGYSYLERSRAGERNATAKAIFLSPNKRLETV